MAKIFSRYDEYVKKAKGPAGESRTKQSFRDECNINTLMRRYRQTGTLPMGVGVARYEDFSEVGDLLSAQMIIKRAEAQFQAMPSDVRARFKNSPAEFLQFVNDKKNMDEARKLGLLKDEVVEPKKDDVVKPA